MHTWLPAPAQIIVLILHLHPLSHQSLAQFHNLKALATKTLLEQQTIVKTLLQASLQSCKFSPLMVTNSLCLKSECSNSTQIPPIVSDYDEGR